MVYAKDIILRKRISEISDKSIRPNNQRKFVNSWLKKTLRLCGKKTVKIREFVAIKNHPSNKKIRLNKFTYFCSPPKSKDPK